jgi:hypothetical protein
MLIYQNQTRPRPRTRASRGYTPPGRIYTTRQAVISKWGITRSRPMESALRTILRLFLRPQPRHKRRRRQALPMPAGREDERRRDPGQGHRVLHGEERKDRPRGRIDPSASRRRRRPRLGLADVTSAYRCVIAGRFFVIYDQGATNHPNRRLVDLLGDYQRAWRASSTARRRGRLQGPP